jgi:hypothetical protein
MSEIEIYRQLIGVAQSQVAPDGTKNRGPVSVFVESLSLRWTDTVKVLRFSGRQPSPALAGERAYQRDSRFAPACAIAVDRPVTLMSEKCANVQTAATGQSNQAGRQLFTVYGRQDQSAVLAWLPILLGLLASAGVAFAMCPVPRSQTVSGAGALSLAAAYVVVTAGAGAFVLATCGMIVGRRRPGVSLARFCSVAAWMTPVIAFSMRDSLWAVSTVPVLAALGSGFIYRQHLASSEDETPLTSGELEITRLSQSGNLIPLTFAALLLELGVLFSAVSMARPATVLIGSAVFAISFFHKRIAASNQSRSQFRSQNPARVAITAALAVVFVGASLTPYLAMPSRGAGSEDTGAGTGRSMAKSGGASARPKLGFLRSAGSLFGSLLGYKSQTGGQGRPADEAASTRPYLALQALFGGAGTATGSESSSLERKSKNRMLTALAATDSYPGMILRPEIKDVRIVAPVARREVFDENPNERRADPVSIPFYGAYWFFKASDKTLPADAVESRGDPASMTFKTTDFTPISMEARQNFGSLIDLSCCRAIELVIVNGDRRPGTVAVELILSNTGLPGQPRQSLGILPVISTLRWFPGDDRPPMREVLSFRLPAQTAIQRFDEAIIRFELRSPRERWSAKIAIEKFRLIPRGL